MPGRTHRGPPDVVALLAEDRPHAGTPVSGREFEAGVTSASDDADVAAGAREFLGALRLLAADSTRSFFTRAGATTDASNPNEDPRFSIVTVAE
ncbi:hypothetical protein GCM10010464_25820 [Pseudonocardia yunnanensis]